MASSVPASLVLDRFVSASSADDAHNSLQRILEALQANKAAKGGKKIPDEEDEMTKMPPELIWNDPEILAAFRHVLRTGNHKHHDTEVPLEEGASLVCKIFLEVMEQEPKAPLLEKDGTLLESLIDAISNDSTEEEDAVATPMYTRVLALQLLTRFCAKQPSKAQAQLLQAPNGLHRLGDLLNVNQEEIIRNEALLLAQVISEWPSCAKIWMFSEVADQVMLLAMEEGGLTGGSLLVQDCLDLLFNLCKHDPNNLADLVFQSPALANNLPRLLDLRQGTEFLNPPKKKEVVKKDDDLDDILKIASSNEANMRQDDTVVPKLTEAEERIIYKTLDILALLLGSDALKKSVWGKHLGLCSLLWELALVSPPPPQVPFVCAVPSPELQQKALETAALYFNDPATMEKHAGLDRLLYLVCTGGLGSNLKEKMGISQAALYVIRSTISKEAANEMLMNTLAPPISMPDDDQNQNQPPPPTVIHKLLNTVAENLTATQGIDQERRKIFLAGALGGLSVFFMDQTSREVMLRLTTQTNNAQAATGEEVDDDSADADTPTPKTTSLIESILQAINTMEGLQNSEDVFLSMILLRFLCQWSVDTPSVVQTLLSSNQSSIVLSSLLGIKTKESHKRGVSVLGKLLLGLCMEYMGDEEKCGGWTRSSMMELIMKKSGGVTKYTSALEQFKSMREFGDNMPWSVCGLEFKVWSHWYSGCVLLVRKRVVQELTKDEGDEEEEEDEINKNDGIEKDSSVGGSVRSLQKLVFQQSQEIDGLQQSLSRANVKIESQQNEIATYKRRIESAPSQLDSMLDEFTTKTSDLESQVAKLEEEKRALKEKFESDLESRDDRIIALQKELNESKVREKESRDEAETLREEIDSLSQAYTSLEREYRQQEERHGISQTASHIVASSEQEAGDQAQEGQPEHSQQLHMDNNGGSTAISALRAENERLRSDAQAADQWMAMAVEKLKGLGEQNAALQTELNILRQSQSDSMNEQQQRLQSQYQALFDEKQSHIQHQRELQAQLENSANDFHQLQQVLDQEKEKHLELQQQLSQTREELQSDRIKFSASETELVRKVEMLESEVERADVEVDRLKNELSVREQQQHEIQQNQFQDVETSEAEELKSLHRQVEAARVELDEAKRHEQEEVYKREARIRELEARLGNEFRGGYTEEDIKSRDEEISELRAANEAAQDWMAKAVEHHQMLSEQHASASAENSDLKAQVRELKAKVGENEALVSKAYVLEQESSMQASQLREAQSSLAMYEDEVKKLREELSSSKEQASGASGAGYELERLRDEVQELGKSLREKVDTIGELRSQLSSEAESKAAVNEKVRALKKQVEEHENEANRLRDEVEALRVQQQSSSDDARKISELSSKLFSVKEANAELERAQRDDQSTIDQLRAEMASFRSVEATMTQPSPEESHTHSSAAQDSRSRQASVHQPLQASDTNIIFGSATTHTGASAAHDFFGSAPVSTPDTSARSAQEIFGPVQTAAASQIASTQHLFGSGRQEGPSSSANDVFRSSPAMDQASLVPNSGEGPNAHDVFGGIVDVVTAHDVFGSGSTMGRTRQPSTADTVDGDEGQSSGGAAEVRKNSQPQEKTQVVVDLEARVHELTVELENAKKKVQEDEDIVRAWEERVAELESTVEDLETQLSEQEQEANNVISHWQATCNALEKKNAELAQSLHGHQEPTTPVLSEENGNTIESLRAELNDTKTALNEAKAKLNEDGDIVTKWEERVQELELTITDMEAQLTEQEEEAMNAIAKWQDTCAALEKKNFELVESLQNVSSSQGEGINNKEEEIQDSMKALQTELQETKTALASAKAVIDEDGVAASKWEERAAELDSTVKDLEEQLSGQEQEANNAIAKWQETCTALEDKNNELTRALQASKNSEPQDNLESLETSSANNTTALSEWGEREKLYSQVEMDATIAKLKQSYNALEAKNADLTKLLETVTEAKQVAVSELEQKLATQAEEGNATTVKWQESYNALEAKNAELSASLESISNQATIAELEQKLVSQDETANATIARWQESYDALEAKNAELTKSLEVAARANQSVLSELEQKLASQEEEANAMIAKWQESHNALEVKNAELSALLETATPDQAAANELEQRLASQKEEAETIIAKWQESYNAVEAKNAELTKSLEVGAEANQAAVSELEQKLASHEEEAKAATAKWQDSYNALEAKNAELTALLEAAPDQAAVSELEQELASQAEEANVTIAKWQESYNALEAKNAELSALLETATSDEAAVSEVEQKLASQEREAETIIANWQGHYNALEAKNTELTKSLEAGAEANQAAVRELEQKLASKEEEAEATIAKWQESYNALETKNTELTKSLELGAGANQAAVSELEHKLATHEEEAEATIAKWQESYNALEAKNAELSTLLEAAASDQAAVSELEQELASQAEEANVTIAKWQESYNALEAKNAELSALLETATSDQAAASELEQKLASQEEEAEAIIAKWQESYNALEAENAELTKSLEVGADANQAAVSELEQKLASQEEEAAAIIAKWQESYNALERKNTELTKSLEVGAEANQAAVSELEHKLATHEEEAKAATAKWQDSYNALEAKNAELTALLEAAPDQAAVSELEQELASQAEEANVTIAKWQESYNALEAKNAELSALLETATSDEAAVSELEQKLAFQEEEAKATIAKWQESYNALEAKNSELTQALEMAKASQQEAESALSDARGYSNDAETRVSELEAKVGDLETRLKEQDKWGSDAIKEWQENNSALQDRNVELSRLLEEARSQNTDVSALRETVQSLQTQLSENTRESAEANEKLQDDDNILRKWEKQIKELESTIQDLEQQLSDQEEEANTAISQWQERSSQLEREVEDLSNSLQTALEKSKESDGKDGTHETDRQGLEELEEMKQKISELQSNVEQSEISLFESKEKVDELNESLQASQDKIAELETTVEDLEDQIKAKDKDLANSIAEWQEHCMLLESKTTELSEALGRARSDAVEDSEPGFPGFVDQKSSELQDRIAELEAQNQEIIRELETTEEEAAAVVQQWQESYAALEEAYNECKADSEGLCEEKRSLQEIRDSLSAELEQYKNLEKEARKEVTSLNTRLESLGDEINMEWESKLEELNSKIALLESTSNAGAAASSLSQGDTLLEALKSRLALKEGELSNTLLQLETAKKERDDALAARLRLSDDPVYQPERNIESSWSDDLDDIDIGETDKKDTGVSDEDIQEVTSRLNDLQEEVQRLTEERDEVSEALKTAKETIETLTMKEEETRAETEDVMGQWAERTRNLETRIQELEEQLEHEAFDAKEAIASWDSRCSELQESLDESTKELERSRAQLFEVLRAELGFKNKLLSSYGDTYDTDQFTRDDWQEEENMEDLKTKLDASNSLLENAFGKLDSELTTVREDLRNSLIGNDGTTNFGSQEDGTSETLVEETLNARIHELERQIGENEASIVRLEESLVSQRDVMDTLKSDKAEIEAEMEKERQEKESLQEQVETLRSDVAKSVSDAGQEKAAKEILQRNLEDQRQRLSELMALEEMERPKVESKDNEKLLDEKNSLEYELGQLKKRFFELENELQEANDSLQVYVTQDVSDKATEMASQALREQLFEIRRQAEADRASVESEKEARIAAQREVERLRADLLALIDINEEEKELYGSDALVLKAGEKIHRKERSELTELRKSLSRAVDELKEARASEKNAEERAAKAALNVAVYEEELASAKSDMYYLIQAMDEMREAEAARRASLENRISSLDNELDVMRRYATTETDNLRNELTQANLEKDRILQSLKQSEKSNTAMIFAASREHPVNTDQSPEAELVKLRIEKAQLLVAASEEGVRTERRLREVVATELSSAEADILVERERRLAAEAAVKNMQLLVTELQSDAHARQEYILRGNSSTKHGLEHENDRLRQEIDKLSEENASLRLKLDAADSEKEKANYEIEKLKEDCRIALAKSHRLDREARFNTEVQAELTRLRVSPKKQPTGQIVVQEDPARDKSDEVAELYEKVQQQKEAIYKERETYRALEAEHEELLVVLAKQEELKSCLLGSLMKLGGQEAVDAAKKEARQNVKTQYGAQ